MQERSGSWLIPKKAYCNTWGIMLLTNMCKLRNQEKISWGLKYELFKYDVGYLCTLCLWDWNQRTDTLLEKGVMGGEKSVQLDTRGSV